METLNKSNEKNTLWSLSMRQDQASKRYMS